MYTSSIVSKVSAAYSETFCKSFYNILIPFVKVQVNYFVNIATFPNFVVCPSFSKICLNRKNIFEYRLSDSHFNMSASQV